MSRVLVPSKTGCVRCLFMKDFNAHHHQCFILLLTNGDVHFPPQWCPCLCSQRAVGVLKDLSMLASFMHLKIWQGRGWKIMTDNWSTTSWEDLLLLSWFWTATGPSIYTEVVNIIKTYWAFPFDPLRKDWLGASFIIATLSGADSQVVDTTAVTVGAHPKTMVHCAGCERPILDRFLLNVLDRAWHIKCVQCCECKCNLTEKCFSREGKLYCKNDFFR